MIKVGDRVRAEGLLGNVVRRPKLQRDANGKPQPLRAWVQWDDTEGQQLWREDALEKLDYRTARSFDGVVERVSQGELAARQRAAHDAGHHAAKRMFHGAQHSRKCADFESACRLLWAELLASSLEVTGVYHPGEGDPQGTGTDVGFQSMAGQFVVTMALDDGEWQPDGHHCDLRGCPWKYEAWTSLGYDDALAECEGVEHILDDAVIKAAAEACEKHEKGAIDGQ